MYFHIPEEGKFKSYFHLLKCHIYFHFALFSIERCLAHSKCSNICSNNLLLTLSDFTGYATLEEKHILYWVQTYQYAGTIFIPTPLSYQSGVRGLDQT